MTVWHPRLTGDKWYPAEESAQRMAESVPGQRIATTIGTSGSPEATSTTFVQVDSVTAALVSGRTYRVRFTAGTEGTPGDQAMLSIFEDTLGGSEIQRRGSVVGSDAIPNAFVMEVEYTASSTGDKTFVVGIRRASGSGNGVACDGASSRPRYLYVDYLFG